MESLAGLARVSLAQGAHSTALRQAVVVSLSNHQDSSSGQALAQAQTQVEDILSHLETNSLDGTDEPLRVYLTCYRVLKANRDPRAQEILTTAYNLLQKHAGNTTDEEMRRSFLENVLVHRELVREWESSE